MLEQATQVAFRPLGNPLCQHQPCFNLLGNHTGQFRDNFDFQESACNSVEQTPDYIISKSKLRLIARSTRNYIVCWRSRTWRAMINTTADVQL